MCTKRIVYIAYVLLFGHHLIAPVSPECVMAKCIYYLYFFSEMSIYFCVLIFITRTLWHNSKHNKCAPSGIERFGGVLGPCLIIFCAVTQKKKKKTGKEETYWEKKRIIKNAEEISTLQVFKPVPFVVCTGITTKTDSWWVFGIVSRCHGITINYYREPSFLELHHPHKNVVGRHAQGCNKRLFSNTTKTKKVKKMINKPTMDLMVIYFAAIRLRCYYYCYLCVP